MFTREEVASKSIEELQQLAKSLGIEPVGNPGYPNSWIVRLLVAGKLGVNYSNYSVSLVGVVHVNLVVHHTNSAG